MHDMVCVHSSSWWQLSRIPAASKINKGKKQENNNIMHPPPPPTKKKKKKEKKKHFVTSVYAVYLYWIQEGHMTLRRT